MEDIKTVIGIVVSKIEHSGNWYVWTKEAFAGRDGILTPRREKPVNIGDWIRISFTNNEYNKFFPEQKTQLPPRFESSNYHVIEEMYSTTTYNNVIRVKFNWYMVDNGDIFEHHFFGKIRNSVKICVSGRKHITIRRALPYHGQDSVWYLEGVEDVIPNLEKNFDKIGIVVSNSSNVTSQYVWCRESVPVGNDVLIQLRNGQQRLKIGTWIRLKVTEQEEDTFFRHNRFRGSFRCYEFVEIEPIHKTIPSSSGKNNIRLELDCYIKNGSRDVYHPFVEIIRNNDHAFDESGKYRIQIARVIPDKASDGVTDSVWVLKDKKIQRESLSLTPLSNRLEHHLSSLSIQSHRSSSPQPIAAPRRSLVSPTQNDRNALVTRINNYSNNREQINVWLLSEHKLGTLKLDVAAEKYCLEPGKQFTASFNNQFNSFGPVSNVDDLYEVKEEEHRGSSNTLLFKICSGEYGSNDNESGYPYIYHENFGNILDNRGLLQNIGLKYHVWIRLAKVGVNNRWVVAEQI